MFNKYYAFVPAALDAQPTHENSSPSAEEIRRQRLVAEAQNFLSETTNSVEEEFIYKKCA